MIFHVFANRSNIGDWLSAIGIQSLLGDPEVTELLCDKPFVPSTLSRLSEAGPDDTVIIGGGGLFMDYFEPFWRGFAELAPNLTFVVWGVGLVDLKREPSRIPASALGAILRHAALCRVRDELTRDHLRALDLSAPLMCPSIAVVPAARPDAGSMLHVTNYDTVGQPAYDVMRSSAQRFASATGRRYTETNNLISQGDRTKMAATLALYQECDLVVSSALHGCIIAVAMGRHVLAVSGDRKIEAFMEAVGLGGWVVGHDRVSTVESRWGSLIDQPDVSARVGAQLRANRTVAAEVAGLLA